MDNAAYRKEPCLPAETQLQRFSDQIIRVRYRLNRSITGYYITGFDEMFQNIVGYNDFFRR